MASGLFFTLLLGLSVGLWAGADAGCRLRAATCDDCPPGWTWYEGRCFLFVKEEKNWADAEKHCLSLEGHLASFHSKNEYNFIRDLIYKATGTHKTSWAGGHDGPQDGFWMWTDGLKFVFDSWGPNEPNNYGGDERCMNINPKELDYVNDAPCSSKLSFICARVV
uniref:Lectin C-type domain containing protein n=1 Tax=Fundulus heteroclitus TaxID=8078 RepID=A0A146UDD9_FUNHE